MQDGALAWFLEEKEGSAGTGKIPFIWSSGNNKNNKTRYVHECARLHFCNAK